ncbi:MAG: hypothetical protein ACI9CD_000385 [Candidatus Deianiraeaceae bacterium]|jgi:hypothetical protein
MQEKDTERQSRIASLYQELKSNGMQSLLDDIFNIIVKGKGTQGIIDNRLTDKADKKAIAKANVELELINTALHCEGHAKIKTMTEAERTTKTKTADYARGTQSSKARQTGNGCPTVIFQSWQSYVAIKENNLNLSDKEIFQTLRDRHDKKQFLISSKLFLQGGRNHLENLKSSSDSKYMRDAQRCSDSMHVIQSLMPPEERKERIALMERAIAKLTNGKRGKIEEAEKAKKSLTARARQQKINILSNKGIVGAEKLKQLDQINAETAKQLDKINAEIEAIQNANRHDTAKPTLQQRIPQAGNAGLIQLKNRQLGLNRVNISFAAKIGITLERWQQSTPKEQEILTSIANDHTRTQYSQTGKESPSQKDVHGNNGCNVPSQQGTQQGSHVGLLSRRAQTATGVRTRG